MGVLAYRKSGDCEVWALSAGTVKMDGGAIFGVVPKPLWEKCAPADKRNRIAMGMNCLLVRKGNNLILVETGFGGKLSEKLKEIYALDESNGLPAALDELGIAPEQITHVVVTHLHQDHAGGCTVDTGDGYAPAFPNATHYVQSGEWDDAENADGQTVKGYRYEEVMRPLAEAGLVTWLDGDGDICDGVHVLLTPGHTRRHQSVLVETGAETYCYTGDIIPMRHHLRPIYVTAYDLFPRESYVNKQDLMARAMVGNWILMWPHDPDMPWARLRRDEEGQFVPKGL